MTLLKCVKYLKDYKEGIHYIQYLKYLLCAKLYEIMLY